MTNRTKTTINILAWCCAALLYAAGTVFGINQYLRDTLDYFSIIPSKRPDTLTLAFVTAFIVAVPALVVFICTRIGRKREIERLKILYNRKKRVSITIADVITELKKKANEKIKDADRFFYLIITTLVAGLLTFIFAYTFTSSTDLEGFLNSERKLIEESSESELYAFMFPDRFDLLYKIDRLGNLPGQDTTKIILIRSTVVQYIKDYNDSLITHKFDGIEDRIKNELKTTNYEAYNFANTALVRFGSVVIVLFLVQILIRVFRYNVRLANFYNARASALEVYLSNRDHPDKLTLEMLTAMLSPDGIDMGMQKNPTDHFSEWVKAALNNIQR